VEATFDSDSDILFERLEEAEALFEPSAEVDIELLTEELSESTRERELEDESL